MNAETAKAIAAYTLADNDQERATTKRLIAAIPAGKEGYTPPQSMTASPRLASRRRLVLPNGVCAQPTPAATPGKRHQSRKWPRIRGTFCGIERAKALSEQRPMIVDFGFMQAPAVSDADGLTASITGQPRLLAPMGAKVPASTAQRGKVPTRSLSVRRRRV